MQCLPRAVGSRTNKQSSTPHCKHNTMMTRVSGHWRLKAAPSDENRASCWSTTVRAADNPEHPRVPMASTSAPSVHGGDKVPQTLHEALMVFGSHVSTQVTLFGLAAVLLFRGLEGFGAADMLVAVCAATLWLTQEWVIHKYLLHAPFQWIGTDIHLEHHKQPYYHISIDSLQLVVPFMMGSGLLFWVALDQGTLSLTATFTYWLFGLLYEWIHFLVHTQYVPRSALGRAIRSHHMLHHMHNEGYWLAFTVPWVDKLLGTAPSPARVSKTQLARSALKGT